MKFKHKYKYNYYELRPSLDSLRLGLLTSALQQSNLRKLLPVQCNTVQYIYGCNKVNITIYSTAAVKPKKVLANAVEYTAVLCNSTHTGNATQRNWVIPY